MTGTYIINPKWFYWLAVCNNLKQVVLCTAFICLIVFAAFLIKALCEADSSYWKDEEVQKPLKTSKKWAILASILFILFVFSCFYGGNSVFLLKGNVKVGN